MYKKPVLKRIQDKEIETLLTPYERKVLVLPFPVKSKKIIFNRLRDRLNKVCLVTPGGKKYNRIIKSKDMCIYLTGDNVVEIKKRY